MVAFPEEILDSDWQYFLYWEYHSLYNKLTPNYIDPLDYMHKNSRVFNRFEIQYYFKELLHDEWVQRLWEANEKVLIPIYDAEIWGGKEYLPFRII